MVISAKKKNEIIAFVWLIAAILLFFCLVSYDPRDIPWNSSHPNIPPVNYVGIFGAYAAWILSVLIGKGAYGWVLLFVFWSLAQWSDRPSRNIWLSILSGTLFFISSATSLSLIFSDANASLNFDAGGMIGYFCATILYQSFGAFALFVSMSIFFIALMLATDFILLPILWAIIKKIYPYIQKASLRLFSLLKKTTQSVQPVATLKKPGNEKTKIKIIDWENQPDHASASSSESLELSNVGPKSAQQVKSASETERTKKSVESKQTKDPIPNKSSEKSEKQASSLIEAQGFLNYKLPPISILEEIRGKIPSANTAKIIEEQSAILQETLADFGVDAKVVEAEQGPVITRFELQPASGVKLQRITSLQDNISLALKATSVRILAPIPGKNRVGIEVPNPEKRLVSLRSILQSSAFKDIDSKLAIALGMDAAGKPLVADLDQMPHILIAGSTGSGKTVCVNTIIMSILFNATPNEVKFIMIDPKMVELNCYNGIPHLLLPVVTNVDKAPNVLNWLTLEMERRYKLLSKSGDREVEAYNKRILETPNENEVHLPYIVVIIDELADLMMAKGKEIETSIARLAQLARAIGIHMILATQRPSVDVITGVIKANFPARIAFQVASKVDSRTVLDSNGADALLGKGDLLFMHPANSHLLRGQGAWVTNSEIQKTIEIVKQQGDPVYHNEILQNDNKKSESGKDFRQDHNYPEACRIIVASGQASVSMLQRRLGLGYTRAARLIDMMEEDGIIGPNKGAKPREVLLSPDEYEARLANSNNQSEPSEDESE